MKINFLLSILFIGLYFSASSQNSGKSYAITGRPDKAFLWADIKEVDIATGKVIKTLFESNVTKYNTTYLDAPQTQDLQNNNPTVFGVAACAFDAKHNRLYFAPMHISDIRYLDLNKSGAEFTVAKRNVVPTTKKSVYQSEDNQFTRMVIGANGYGYVLTNDANHFIRFTTGGRSVVEDLGNLIDAESNAGISVHNKCTSWGGDMVADAFGKLVMISASHNIFSIDVNTRIATYKGTISGLPANYTTNGAVVDAEGSLVVSSANVFDALYKVDMKNLKATRMESVEKPFNASDLANGNLLYQKEANAARKFGEHVAISSLDNNPDTRVFPNPVTAGQFKVFFDKQGLGKYNITLTDLSGKAILSKSVTVSGKGQVEVVQVGSNVVKGMYMVKVTDASNKFVFTERIVIQ